MADESLRVPEALSNIDGIHETIEQIHVETETTHETLQALLEALDRHGCLRESKEYNGWSNYSTWDVHLWLTNDQGTYNLCRELARESVEEASTCSQIEEGIWTEVQARRFLLADRLRDHIDEINPLVGEASLFSDLLGAAIQDVDWHEVADAFLEEFPSVDDGE